MQKSLGDIIAKLITDNTKQYRVINDYTLKVAFTWYKNRGKWSVHEKSSA